MTAAAAMRGTVELQPSGPPPLQLAMMDERDRTQISMLEATSIPPLSSRQPR
jgi:hypothetical protein